MNRIGWHLPILRSERGAALLIMLLLLFTVALAVILNGFGNRGIREREDAATAKALMQAKEAVIAFAVMYADNYPVGGAGIGHLMCPDTAAPAFDASGNPLAPYGLPNALCGPNAIGRLPHFVTLPSGNPLPLSDYGSGIDQQFWYAVANAFLANPNGGIPNIVNSTSPGTLSLDGQSDVVAVIIAPGPALGGQNRSGTNPAAYLEAGNSTGPAFVSGWPADPANFNDRVLAIRRSDLLLPMTARVAEEMKKHLDAYHTAGGAYPADQAAFAGAFTGAPPWLATNNWLTATTTTYTLLSGDKATLAFAGCGITYTLTFGSSVVVRSQTHC